MGSKTVKMVGLILVASAAAALSATAAENLQSRSVAQRQQDMKAMAAAAKTINAMFKGSSAYDAKAFKAAAETIRSRSGNACRLFSTVPSPRRVRRPAPASKPNATSSKARRRPWRLCFRNFSGGRPQPGCLESSDAHASRRCDDRRASRQEGGRGTGYRVDARRARLSPYASDLYLLPRQVSHQDE